MQEAYLRLIREYPTSKYIPNAYLSFADYKFGNNQIPDALRSTSKIVDGYKDSPVYAYALYKMGWCYLNPIGTAEPEYRKSLNKFVETIGATLAGKAGNEANAKQLRRDARRDLVKAYVHAGKPSAAWGFFQKVGNGPKKSENMDSQDDGAAGGRLLRRRYVRRVELHLQEAPGRVQLRRAALRVAGPDRRQRLGDGQQRHPVEGNGQAGQYWEEYKSGKFKKATKKKCRDEARDTMRQMATVWHDEAEKTRKQETYDLAEQAYQAYVQHFPKDKDAYEMSYYYAELLWAQGVNYYGSKDRASQEVGLKKFRGRARAVRQGRSR